MVVVDTSGTNEKNGTVHAMSPQDPSSKNGIVESATYANGFLWETSILFNRNLTNIFRVCMTNLLLKLSFTIDQITCCHAYLPSFHILSHSFPPISHPSYTVPYPYFIR